MEARAASGQHRGGSPQDSCMPRPRSTPRPRPGTSRRACLTDDPQPAWNAADACGEVERPLAAVGAVVDGAVRRELAEDLTGQGGRGVAPLLGRTDVPKHVRDLTSTDVLAVEHELVDRIARRAEAKTLIVMEGAAGAGKTTRLAATRKAVEARGHQMLVVTPTRKAAQVAIAEASGGRTRWRGCCSSTGSVGTRTGARVG